MSLFVCNTEFTEVNLSAFVYRLFHEDFFSLIGTFVKVRLGKKVEKSVVLLEENRLQLVLVLKSC